MGETNMQATKDLSVVDLEPALGPPKVTPWGRRCNWRGSSWWQLKQNAWEEAVTSKTVLGCMLGCWVLLACHQPDLCTTEAVSGIHVTLTDALSHNPVCDATVMLKGGNGYSETMTAQPGNPCSYAGAFERPGSYEVDVSHPRYRPATRRDVTVDQDSCHVVTQQVALELSPL